MRSRSRLSSHQSRKFQSRKKTRTAVSGAIIVLGAVAWIIALSRLTTLPSLSINEVYIKGGENNIAPELEQAAYGAMDGSYLGLFAKSSSFIFPSKAIAAAVMGVSPQLASVSVSRDGFNGLMLTVTEKAPAALICTDLPDFSNSTPGGCYFADGTGRVYEAAPAISDGVYPRYYVPSLGGLSDTAIIGAYATSTEEFDKLQKFYSGLNGSGFNVDGILVKDGGEYELYVQNPTTASTTAVIYFDHNQSFDAQLINLVSFWKQMSETARTDGKPLDYDYIDLRYGANVFYRLAQ
ncbi:MAG: hypothetical protein KGI59_01580 [Patescibacteria group bacterium]|nr:hypothetical protein [Patescibacteria group bacterium]MDE2172809.1 hypothetical protein [Patescibacteria group bacterium]